MSEAFIDLMRPCVAEFGVDVRERFAVSSAYDRELTKAVRLAPSLEVCEALLLGEQVPVSRLDREWAKAYGLL